MTPRGGIYGDRHGDGSPVRQSGRLVSGDKKLVALGDVLDLIQTAAQSVGEPAVGKFIADKVRSILG